MKKIIKISKAIIFLGVFLSKALAYAGDPLTIGLMEFPSDLHPYANTKISRSFLEFLWFSPLVIYEEGSGWQCGACAELPSYENKMVAPVTKGKYKLLKTIWRLNRDQRWGDGTPVTSKDFILAWEVVRAIRDTDSSAWTSLSEIYDVEPGGNPRELIIWFGGKTPDYTHLHGFFPLPSHLEKSVWESSDKVPRIYFGRTTLTMRSFNKGAFNGSFLPSIKNDREIYLTANKQRKPEAKLSQLRVVKFDNIGSIAWALRNRVIHLLPEGQLPYESLIDLQKQLQTKEIKGAYQFQYIDTNQLQIMAFNLRNPLLSDVKFRRALSYGTNRKHLVEDVFARTKVYADDWPVTLAMKSTLRKWRFDFSRSKAQKLLDELDWHLPNKPGVKAVRFRDGERLTLQIHLNDNSEVRKRIAENLKEQWESLGIEVQLNAVNGQKFQEVVLPRASFQDIALASFELFPGSSPRNLLHDKAIPSFENNYIGQNFMGWHDRDVSEAISAWEDPSLDETQRQKVQDAVIERIQAEVPFIPLFRHTEGAVQEVRVNGFKVGTFWGPSSQNAQGWQWSRTTAVNP